MKDCPYEIGDKVIFRGEVFEVSYITTMYNYGFLDVYSVYLKGFGWVRSTEIEPISKGEQMTNKQEAKQQLEKLEAEVQKLKEIINKPEKAGSLLEDGEWLMCLQPYHWRYGTQPVDPFNFESSSIAQSYAEAFNTMLALRKCEGSECCIDDKFQSAIGISQSLEDLRVFNYTSSYAKFDSASPMFISEEYAQAAIDKVGKENIIKMFKTLHGIYD